MDIDAFIDNVVAQFDNVSSKQVGPETDFRELEGWSSLVALSIIAMCDEEYGVALKGDDIKNAKSVQDLFNTVAQRASHGVL